MMYVYSQIASDLWTVGFFQLDGTWVPESDHVTADEAASRVHYLNGSRSDRVSKRDWDETHRLERLI